MAKSSRGSALITALFIMAIVAIAATAMALRVQIDIRRLTLNVNADKSYALAQGVVFWATGDLIERQKNRVIDPNQQTIAVEGYENAIVAGTLEDAQARFNLNNLANSDREKQKQAIDAFQRLIELVAPSYANQARQVALATAEWVSLNFKPLAETKVFYENVKPPYKIAHQLMTSPSELRLVAGVTPELYRQLQSYIIAIPDETEININLNSASRSVLLAVNPKLTSEDADNFIKKRESLGGFKNDEQLKKESLLQIKGVTQSNYFLIHAHVELDQIKQDVFTLLKRQDKDPKILTMWESRGTL